MPAKTPAEKRQGWWEDYECGCVLDTVPSKKDLCGYCPKHGDDRRHIWPSQIERRLARKGQAK